MGKKTIVLNRICTGDYLDEGTNLGHEVVNLFKSDKTDNNEGNYYIYLMSDGAYPSSRKDDEIQAVYFTKAINAGCVEVVAIATGVKTIFEPCKGWKCFKGGGGKPELDYLFLEQLSMENLKAVQRSVNFDDSLLDWLNTEKFQGMKPFADNRTEEMSKTAEDLYNLANNIANQGKDYTALCKAIRRRAAHIEQLVYIIKNDVRYGGKRLNELFAYNSSEQYGLAIYLTYKAKKIQRPNKKTYLIINKDYEVKSKNVENIIIERDRLATTTLATYFDENGSLTKKDKIMVDENGKKIREFNEKTKKLETKRIKLTPAEIKSAEEREKKNYKTLCDKTTMQGRSIEEYKSIEMGSDFTFLTLIRKEYDELVFSNMFQYFFTHPTYRKLFKDFLGKYGIDISDNYVIRREEAYIDLLVEDDNWVVVIENKVKSGINGLIFDDGEEIQGTQLQTYRNYVEGNPKYKNKGKRYFLFKPNYSIITEQELNGYTPVSYGELADSFRSGIRYEAGEEVKVYFSDFIKALDLHATDTDNRHEEIMRKRLQNLLAELSAEN